LPDTIQGIVLSRIDRLPPEEQLTLKVAAVIGRTFAYTTLHDTLGEHMEISHRLLKAYLDDLTLLDLTPLEAPEPELTYIFKHIITQEVAYETLLFAQRRQLHRAVARWYERTFGDDAGRPVEEGPESSLAPYYPLLVYHWHQAGDKDRERHYAGLAGKWAATQFANVEAAGYFSRALELTPEADLAARYDLLLAREAVNDLRGERETQAQDLVTLVLLIKGMKDHRRDAEIALRLANYTEVTSDYSAALIAVDRVIEQAARVQDLAVETEGHIAQGKVLWRRGDYDAAHVPLERALGLARATNNRRAEAKGLYYLGHVYLYQGNYPAAREHYQQALDIYRADGHRQGEADSLSNLGIIYDELGDYPAARDHYEQVLAIFRTTGDRHGETMTLNNLGVVYCDLGDYEAARDYHDQALDLRLAIGDRWGEANSLVNLGLVYHDLGNDGAAREHCQQALAIQREIGDRRGEGYSLTYLGHALAGLGELEAAAEAYDKAMRLRRELGHHGLAMDDLAGLARVALAQGDSKRARGRVEEILAWIEDNGSEGGRSCCCEACRFSPVHRARGLDETGCRYQRRGAAAQVPGKRHDQPGYTRCLERKGEGALAVIQVRLNFHQLSIESIPNLLQAAPPLRRSSCGLLHTPTPHRRPVTAVPHPAHQTSTAHPPSRAGAFLPLASATHTACQFPRRIPSQPAPCHHPML
jgi:tetratricopeptide (TPR) repeat protein